MATVAKDEVVVLGSGRFLRGYGGGGGHGGESKSLDRGQGGGPFILTVRWSLEWRGKGRSWEPSRDRCWGDQSREERWGNSGWRERDTFVQNGKSKNT